MSVNQARHIDWERLLPGQRLHRHAGRWLAVLVVAVRARAHGCIREWETPGAWARGMIVTKAVNRRSLLLVRRKLRNGLVNRMPLLAVSLLIRDRLKLCSEAQVTALGKVM